MFASSFIDTAIGISFVFLLLSLIASTVNEIILSLLRMRGRDLLAGLKTLLNDDDATGLVKRLYNHGLVYGLFKGEFDQKSRSLPSYIPSSNFAAALLDVVRDAAGQPAAVQQNAAAIVQSVREAAQKLAGDEITAKVGRPLVSMTDAAEGDLNKLIKSVEAWYNSAMDRVSGAYKYRTQWLLFLIGLALAAALNADTVRIVKQLSNDPTLRQAVVAAAQSAKQPEGASGAAVKDQIQQVHDQVAQLENIGIPLGWSGVALPCKEIQAGKQIDEDNCSQGEWMLGWFAIFRGWILTAIAVSLGAPFWFDMLNKIMVVRSTVKPREKSPEEPSKDK
jgi:hypothetical protein